jgi:hypothetical protein
MHGGTVHSVTLDPGEVHWNVARQRQRLFYNGVMVRQPKPRALTPDHAFIAYAGSWAQARCEGRDVAEVLETNTTDCEVVSAVDPSEAMLAQWSQELENAWPRIQSTAQRMYGAHMDFAHGQIGKRRNRIRRRKRQR